MILIKKLKKVCKNPGLIVLMLLNHELIGRCFSDKIFLQLKYHLCMGKKLKLKNPETFSEKLQWLKLYYRKPEQTMMADKYAVRAYIAEMLGEEYLIPLLGVWDSPDEINFDALPNQFVLKCNHNSGTGMIICKDKKQLDIEKAKRELHKGLKQNYYLSGREWPYKNIPRKIVAEKFMSDGSGKSLKDYKFMCFHGEVKCCFLCVDRNEQGKAKIVVYDREWNNMGFGRNMVYHMDIPKPIQYDKMIELAEVLAKDFPFSRIDFYEIEGQIYFGEITFYPASGLEGFTPQSWDEKLGSWISIES